MDLTFWQSVWASLIASGLFAAGAYLSRDLWHGRGLFARAKKTVSFHLRSGPNSTAESVSDHLRSAEVDRVLELSFTNGSARRIAEFLTVGISILGLGATVFGLALGSSTDPGFFALMPLGLGLIVYVLRTQATTQGIEESIFLFRHNAELLWIYGSPMILKPEDLNPFELFERRLLVGIQVNCAGQSVPLVGVPRHLVWLVGGIAVLEPAVEDLNRFWRESMPTSA